MVISAGLIPSSLYLANSELSSTIYGDVYRDEAFVEEKAHNVSRSFEVHIVLIFESGGNDGLSPGTRLAVIPDSKWLRGVREIRAVRCERCSA